MSWGSSSRSRRFLSQNFCVSMYGIADLMSCLRLLCLALRDRRHRRSLAVGGADLAAPTVHRRYAPAHRAGGSHQSLTSVEVVTLCTSRGRWLDLEAAAASDVALPQNCNGEWHPPCAVKSLSFFFINLKFVLNLSRMKFLTLDSLHLLD